MIRRNDIRDLLESHNGDAGVFARRMTHYMGVSDQHGNPYFDDGNNMTVRDPRDDQGKTFPRIKPSEISFGHLGRGLLGHDLFEEVFEPGSRRGAGHLVAAAMAGAGLNLREASDPVMPSAFANINAFTAVVTGLLEVSILEGWENPDFIGEQLMPDEPSKVFEGRKVIGTARIGDLAEERLPGMPTKRVKFGERWIEQPRTVENAMACEVTQEAVFLDLTGQVTQECNNLGEWLRYRKELRQIDAFIGVTNTYKYKGTSYNTYQTASTWDNDFSNELLHESDFEEVLIKFRDMTDQETGTRVMINPNTVLVNRGKVRTAAAILGPTAIATEYRSNDSAGTPMSIRTSEPFYKNKYKLLESPLVYERCDAADGLNLSTTNAEKYWWVFEQGKRTIVYVSNWPLRVQQGAPGQVDMIDRGVVQYVKADERGVPMWIEPRRVVRCKN